MSVSLSFGKQREGGARGEHFLDHKRKRALLDMGASSISWGGTEHLAVLYSNVVWKCGKIEP